MQKKINTLMSYLQENIPVEKYDDAIEELYNEKIRTIYDAIKDNPKNRNYTEEMNKLYKKMQQKCKGHNEIFDLLEKYIDIAIDRIELNNILMYKYGIYDGMTLIIDGTKQINKDKQ